jgi:hypothetical protein
MYDALTPRDIIYYDQPSENADCCKPKREKEKHDQRSYTRRFGGSLTGLNGTCVVGRPGLRFGTDQPRGLVFRKYTSRRYLWRNSASRWLLCTLLEDLARVRTRDYRRLCCDVRSANIRRGWRDVIPRV